MAWAADLGKLRADLLDLLEHNQRLIQASESNLSRQFAAGYKRRDPFSTMNLQVYQGEIFRSPRPTHLAINGQGWFGIRHGRDTFYTRNGRFIFQHGILSTESGHPVLGFQLDGQGNIVSEPGEIKLALDDRTKLYAGLYTGFHFEETGVLYGEKEGKPPVPLNQLALYSVAAPQALGSVNPDWLRETPASGHPVTGVAGQGALGAIYPGRLELSNVDVLAESSKLEALRQYSKVLGGTPGWRDIDHSPTQDIRRQLARQVAQDPSFYQLCLANLRNQWTPGYKSNDILKTNGRRRRSQPGPLNYTRGAYDLALDGPGYFFFSDGSLSRDGRLGGSQLMARRPGSSVAEPLRIPPDAANLEIRADGSVIWMGLGQEKPELAYRIVLGQVAHPEFLGGDGHRLLPTAASGPVRQGLPDEEELGLVCQGYVEMANTEPYEQRVLVDVLRYVAGLP